MAISLDETLITLPAAAGQFPHRPHASTMWRWATVGVKGTQLEVISIAGRKFTSVEACRRFALAFNGEAIAPDKSPKGGSRRRAQIAAAKRRVRAAGV